MENIWLWIQRHIITYIIPPKDIEIIDIVQVIILAWLIYHVIVWFKNTRAYNLLKGILLIVVFIIIAEALDMTVILWILQNLSIVLITAIVIIFQPELRKALERMGHQNILSNLFAVRSASGKLVRYSDDTITQILRAVMEMCESKTGALIIIEEDIKLDEVVETGIEIDAVVSSQLIVNIFEHNTPLHDGAAIIRENRLISATCYLPLSENITLSKTLGTRHRAGVGITEISDCLAVIVSEETGMISYSFEGVLHSGLSSSDLREVLHEHQDLQKGKRKGRRSRGTKNS